MKHINHVSLNVVTVFSETEKLLSSDITRTTFKNMYFSSFLISVYVLNKWIVYQKKKNAINSFMAIH